MRVWALILAALPPPTTKLNEKHAIYGISHQGNPQFKQRVWKRVLRRTLPDLGIAGTSGFSSISIDSRWLSTWESSNHEAYQRAAILPSESGFADAKGNLKSWCLTDLHRQTLQHTVLGALQKPVMESTISTGLLMNIPNVWVKGCLPTASSFSLSAMFIRGLYHHLAGTCSGETCTIHSTWRAPWLSIYPYM